MLEFGIAVGRNRGRGASSDSTNDRCSVLRRSTIDTNGSTRGGSSRRARKRAELVERARRERGSGWSARVSASAALEHALARQRDARRAVEDRDVVAVGDRVEEQPAQPVGRVLGAVEVEVEVAQREVGGHDVHAGDVGGADVRGERRRAS